MNTIKDSFKFAAVFFALGLFTGCGSTGGGSSSSSVGVYYGVGFYDPWYYGDYDQDIDITLPDRPDRPNRPDRPTTLPAQVNTPRPSTRPSTASSRPSARSMPSIPSTPRPAARGGGGRR